MIPAIKRSWSYLDSPFFAELESMKMSKFGIERENERMRRIIDVYINSSELNDPVFGLLNEDDVSVLSSATHHSAADEWERDAEKERERERELRRRRINAADAGLQQLKNLNRLDVELNEILSGVLTEENRQRVLMKDLLRLFDKNRFLLEGDFSENLLNSNGTNGTTGTNALPVTTLTTASATLTLAGGGGGGGAVTGSSATATRRASVIPHFANVASAGVQVDGKDEYSAVTDTDQPQPAAVNLLGIAPLAPPVIHVRGSDQPFQVPPATMPSHAILCRPLSELSPLPLNRCGS